MITIITPTGGRPEAFALCEKYMARQSLKPDQWIVVDDYPQETICTMGQEIIRPEPFWSEGQMTLPRNLLAGLNQAKGDIVLVIEDDDWYHPDYIKIMAEKLKDHDLVGEGGAWYYNIKNYRYITHDNKEHASLCQTGFSKNILEPIKKLISNNLDQMFLDLKIWKLECNKLIFERLPINIGIKGMPGRGGIGYGHRDTMGKPDSEAFVLLKEWIGLPDSEIYANMK